jgi:diguanylate cyclase (GGDEF)-like protein
MMKQSTKEMAEVFFREILAKDFSTQRVSEDHPRHLVEIDALTGLVNYRTFAETLESETKRSDRTGRAFAMLLFNLNGMKRINNDYGQRGGDQALCRVADIIHSSCRSIDTVARYGGDKFAIILLGSGAKEVDTVRRRICERLSTECDGPVLSVSTGFAVYPEDGKTIETLFQAADRVLYKMKQLERRT